MGKELFESCPGSRAFMAQVREKQKYAKVQSYCMAAIDIEHFRLFNKLYGRKAGDEFLLTVYEYLTETAERYDGIAGYFGADNFCIYLPDQMDLLEEICTQIMSELRKWNELEGFHPLIGVCTEEESEEDPDLMYDRAILALSEGKNRKSGKISRYQPQMESELEDEFFLLLQIQKGLEAGEFTFYAQPQCNISTGKIVGAEALVRWRKENGELVSPGQFIPVLEKNGMIDELDRYVWECVCKWLRSWIDRGHEPVPMSINVSRIDIFSMNVPEYLFALLKKYDLPESLIKIEITESAYTESNEQITGAVMQLRSHGFKVMMDDFGCGYSSLNMLKNIPVDILKLDMRFLDINEADTEKGISILESVVNMARLLRLPIVVEGVETKRQEQFVRGLGCRYSQGFYYYRPLPVERLEELLMNEERLDHQGMIYRQAEPLHLREFIDNSLFSESMLNQILGPVAFFERGICGAVCDPESGAESGCPNDCGRERIEITRANEQYFSLLGITEEQEEEYRKTVWDHIEKADHPNVLQLFRQAGEKKDTGAGTYVRLWKSDGSRIEVYMRLFFLKAKDGKAQYYASLTDMSTFPEKK